MIVAAFYYRLTTRLLHPLVEELGEINWNTERLFGMTTTEYATLRSSLVPNKLDKPALDKHKTLCELMMKDKSTKNYLSDANFDVLGGLDVPVCVLLHPDIREGISFEFSPKIVCIEVPYGVGNRDQINARVLRSVSAHKRKICFIDGTFRFQTNAEKNGNVSTHSIHVLRARPWRATKDVVHLASNESQKRLHMPHWLKRLRKTFKFVPEFVDIPMRVFDYLKGRNVVVGTNDEQLIDYLHSDIAGLNIDKLEANTIYSNFKKTFLDKVTAAYKEYSAQRKHDPVGEGNGFIGWAYQNATAQNLIRGDFDVLRYNHICAEKMSELNLMFQKDEMIVNEMRVDTQMAEEYGCKIPRTCEIWKPGQDVDDIGSCLRVKEVPEVPVTGGLIKPAKRSPTTRHSPTTSRRYHNLIPTTTPQRSPITSRRSPITSRRSQTTTPRRSPITSRRSPITSRRSPITSRRSPTTTLRRSPTTQHSPITFISQHSPIQSQCRKPVVQQRR
jgi:hypothetical protein